MLTQHCSPNLAILSSTLPLTHLIFFFSSAPSSATCSPIRQFLPSPLPPHSFCLLPIHNISDECLLIHTSCVTESAFTQWLHCHSADPQVCDSFRTSVCVCVTTWSRIAGDLRAMKSGNSGQSQNVCDSASDCVCVCVWWPAKWPSFYHSRMKWTNAFMAVWHLSIYLISLIIILRFMY